MIQATRKTMHLIHMLRDSHLGFIRIVLVNIIFVKMSNDSMIIADILYLIVNPTLSTRIFPVDFSWKPVTYNELALDASDEVNGNIKFLDLRVFLGRNMSWKGPIFDSRTQLGLLRIEAVGSVKKKLKLYFLFTKLLYQVLSIILYCFLR